MRGSWSGAGRLRTAARGLPAARGAVNHLAAELGVGTVFVFLPDLVGTGDVLGFTPVAVAFA